MYCRKCGAENEDNAYKCTQCGEILQEVAQETVAAPTAPVAQAAPVASAAPLKIPNYLVQAILLTLFCCLPFGIAAIVFAAQVNGKVQAGDIDGAMESSRKAKMWCWWSFGVGLAANILVVLLQIAGIAASGM